jgi:hypothetical protein
MPRPPTVLGLDILDTCGGIGGFVDGAGASTSTGAGDFIGMGFIVLFKCISK